LGEGHSFKEEFETANQIGLNYIEFILDFNDTEKNPLLKNGGAEETLKVCDNTGISVNTICADYFIEAPLHAIDESVAIKSKEILISLSGTSSKLGVTDIKIPCVDQSLLDTKKSSLDRFINQIQSILPDTERQEINLSLETDLAPQPFDELLNKFDSHRITVNYDIGNSAALGYDPAEQLNTYENLVTDTHLKDRTLNGGYVILGSGNADFHKFKKTKRNKF
jgi:L-ribulose-5-phosphate 3-epimerase